LQVQHAPAADHTGGGDALRVVPLDAAEDLVHNLQHRCHAAGEDDDVEADFLRLVHAVGMQPAGMAVYDE
jgi:hypothetical protein